VELFEEIRREYEFGIASIAGVARKFGVHRRLVREALAGAVPTRRPAPERPRPTIEPVAEFIDVILEADRRAPRKQRHTAHRIWTRITRERPGYQIAESTVRQHVRLRKQALGLRVGPEPCVPQQYAWGDEAQVDWYEADADLDGERQTLQVFAMRSMASGAAFHRAYPRATQQAFLEAHELAFQHLGGVYRCLRYDNLGSAVKKILRGHRREETARFVAFRSHWGFESSFCTPGEGHEKGGVEGEVGFFRRNHLVPVPSARNLDELNAMLLASCREDEARTIDGRQLTVGEALVLECDHLLPMASEGFDLVEVSFARVDGLRRVRIRTNAYSAPLWPGTTVQIKLAAAWVEVWHQGRCVARHTRSYGRHQEVLDLEHYLDVLERKPGAFAGSKPLEQWRQAGRWPTSYDRLWQALMERQGHQAGTKTMIELLQLGREHGFARLRVAIEAALELGCTDAAAVRHLLAAEALVHERPAPLVDLGVLSQYERPLPEVDAYDHLLVIAGAVR
jgi:transposase